MNPRKARWALFFTRFNFWITYRLGSRNIKADALSCYYLAPEATKVPDTILPSSLLLALVAWDIDLEIACGGTVELAPHRTSGLSSRLGLGNRSPYASG